MNNILIYFRDYIEIVKIFGRLRLFHSLDAQHHIIVVENPTNHLLIGTGTIFIEPKIIHNFGFVGHIEDVVVHPDYQGYGVGKIIEKLKQYGDENGCYKCILDCTDDKIILSKICFSSKGSQMSYYYDKKSKIGIVHNAFGVF